ncbi:hypothetical protein EJD97_002309, partial [Solanum chilense]
GQNIQGLTTSTVTCYHPPWAAHTVRRRQACHARMDLGQHKWSGWHAIIALGQHTRLDEVRRGMPSLSLTTHMVGLLWPCHAIIAFEHPKRMNNVESLMPSLPLCSTPGRITSGMACHDHPWIAHMIG